MCIRDRLLGQGIGLDPIKERSARDQLPLLECLVVETNFVFQQVLIRDI